ncbi:uncharacterized protein LOC102807364 [Saccoglossus kowalevskii]
MKTLIRGLILYCSVFTASCLTNHYCTGDQGYEPPNVPGILFVYDSWETERCGLDGFHVTLVKHVANILSSMYHIYSTVLEVSREKCRKAEDENIHLIEPAKKKANYCPSREWFFLHDSYFPVLKSINIKHVVGYSPRTDNAAFTIQNELFNDARLILINHVLPDAFEMNGEIDELVYKAAAAFISIGPLIHEENYLKLQLLGLDEKPHVKLYPFPSKIFFKESVVKDIFNDKTKKIYISTYGHFFHPNIKAVNVLGEVANVFKSLKQSLSLKILCVPDELEIFETINNFVSSSALPLNDVTTYSSCSLKQILRTLRASHLCIIPKIDIEYSFVGIEAIALGVPVLVDEQSQLAAFFGEVFNNTWQHIDLWESKIVENTFESWEEKIRNSLQSLNMSWHKSAALREEFKTSYLVSKSYKEVVALLNHTTINECPECPCKSCLPLKVHCVFNSTNSQTNSKSSTPTNFNHWLWKCTDIITQLTINNKDYQEELECAVQNKCSAIILGYKEGSLIIYITFPNLFSLYVFQGIVNSGTLAREFDKILISEKMRYEAALLNIPFKLDLSYDEEQFKLLATYLINRDGGNSIFSYIDDDVGDDDNVINDDYEEDGMTLEELNNLILKKKASHTENGNYNGDSRDHYSEFEYHNFIIVLLVVLASIFIGYFITQSITRHSTVADTGMFDAVRGFNYTKSFTTTRSTDSQAIEYLNLMLVGLPSKSFTTTRSPGHIEYLNLMLIGRCPSRTERNRFNYMINQKSSMKKKEKETELKRTQKKCDDQTTELTKDKTNHDKEVQALDQQISILQDIIKQKNIHLKELEKKIQDYTQQHEKQLEEKETAIQTITEELKRTQKTCDDRITVLIKAKGSQDEKVQALYQQISIQQDTIKQKDNHLKDLEEKIQQLLLEEKPKVAMDSSFQPERLHTRYSEHNMRLLFY